MWAVYFIAKYTPMFWKSLRYIHIQILLNSLWNSRNCLIVPWKPIEMQEKHKFITKNGDMITSDGIQKMKCTTKVIYQKIERNV